MKIASKKDEFIAAFVAGVCYILLGKISIHYTTMPEGIAVAWLPNAILLALFLTRPIARWAFYVPVILVAEVIADYPTFSLTQAVQFGLINLLETSAAAFFIHKLNKSNADFQDTKYVLIFMSVALTVAPALSALLGALVYVSQINDAKNFIEFWRIWFFGDALGILLLTPLAVLSLKAKLGDWLQMHNIQAHIEALVTISIAFFMFSQGFSSGILPATPIVFILLLLWIVYRHGILYGLAVGAITSFIAVHFTVEGVGPYTIFDTVQNTVYLQEFISALMIITLFFGVLLRQVEENAKLLKESNRAYQELTMQLDAKVKEKTNSLEEANKKLTQMATTDHLTGIYNRRFFEEFASQSISESIRYNKPLSLVIFDIDRFKLINDTHGHKCGDDVLIGISKAVASLIRDSDIFARIGGEEFVILMPNTPISHAQVAAEKLRASIERLDIASDQKSISCTISIGVSEINSSVNSLAKLLHDADNKLYMAKESGRNKVVV